MVGLVLAGSAAWGQLTGMRALERAEGRLISVEAGGGRVQVHTQGRTLTLRVDDSTHIFLPGGMGYLEDLSEGQAVRTVFQRQDEEPEAEWIEVFPADAGR
jgi:phosphoribosylformylglycinamidine (FGAM) synthase-like amidotransferase family enzyme